MHIGVPRETKVYEYRVGMSPASVREAVLAGHEVSVERFAGKAIGRGLPWGRSQARREEKLALVEEACRPGNSVSEVARLLNVGQLILSLAVAR
jgi:alanine dehydrogenase